MTASEASFDEPGIQAAAIGIVHKGDCVLVGERAVDQVYAGFAEFPGGKCHPGESPEVCVIREVLEETGLKVRVLRERQTVEHTYPHGRVRMVFFDCEQVENAEPNAPFRWVLCEELARLNFPEANELVIQDLAKPQPRRE